MKTRLPFRIAPEGFYFIAVSVLISAFVQAFCEFAVAAVFWVITLLVINFFRDPIRIFPNLENVILAPADGKVIVVEKSKDPYRHQAALKISIFMNIFNVHTNRIPVAGVVEDVQYRPGSFFNAALSKSSLQNEQNAVLIKMLNNQKVTIVQIAGLVARRILCYVKMGQKVALAQRYGFIRFGSRIDLYLPVTVQVKVSLGQKVYGARTILASFEM